VKRINIIGCGRAAGSLARLWLDASALAVGDVLNRGRESTIAAVAALGEGTAARRIDSMRAAEIWLIGTGDDQIERAAMALRSSGQDLSGALVFHLAGRFGLDALEPLQGRGAMLAAVHPVRSLTHERLSLEEFRGTACVAEGSEQALNALRPLITGIGGSWLPVRDIDRGLYHAAVAVVSNVTKAVAWKAQNWLQNAGLSETTAAEVTHQLLRSTLEDLFRMGARQSITGPIVRGDTRTIEAHLQAVAAKYPEDLEIYRVLARIIVELARDRGDLDAPTLRRFETLLNPEKDTP
jgi:predicted short-subunit dehydrogenase-like oxidoreductase (DUF2520 family)